MTASLSRVSKALLATLLFVVFATAFSSLTFAQRETGTEGAVDTTPPIVKAKPASDTTTAPNTLTVQLGVWDSGDGPVGPVSGVESARYRIDAPADQDTGTLFNDDVDITIGDVGTHRVYYWARDNAGNVTSGSYGDYVINPGSTNGVCGAAARNYSAAETDFDGALCAAGTANPANPAFPAPGGSTNWVCEGLDGGADSGTCTATRDSLPPSADLSVEKTANATEVELGGSVLYTLEFNNNGPDNATGVVIVDDYDQGNFDVVLVTLPSECIDNGDVLTCTIGNVENGGFGFITYEMEAIAVGSNVENVATIGGNEDDPNAGNNEDNALVDITLTPVDGACGAAARNYSAAETDFDGALCAAGTPNPANPAFPAPAGSSNWVCDGLNGGSNSGTCTATRNAGANFVVTKGADDVSLDDGEVVTYTINVQNTGDMAGYTLLTDDALTNGSNGSAGGSLGLIENLSVSISCPVGATCDASNFALNGEFAFTNFPVGGEFEFRYQREADNDGMAVGATSDFTNTATLNPGNFADVTVTVNGPGPVVVGVNPGDIVLNELMWAGSSASADDEWIELYNTTDQAIDLTGFEIRDGVSDAVLVTLGEGSTIPANGFFLIANFNEDSPSSVLSTRPDVVDVGLALSDGALQIELVANDGSTVIDTAGEGANPSDCAGSNTASMARKFNTVNGVDCESWFTHQLQSGIDNGESELGSPGNSNSTFADAFPETVYEDGESASDWIIYDNSPGGASVTTSDDRIKTEGFFGANAYQIDANWNNNQQKIIQWQQKHIHTINTIYISVSTNNGQKYLKYKSTNQECTVVASPQYITCGIGDMSPDGNLHTVTRDLQADITEAQPGTIITGVRTFLARGNYELDNIKLLSSTSLVHTISGNITKDGLDLENVIVRFESDGDSFIPVRTDSDGNYERFGFTNDSYTVSVEHNGTVFTPDSQLVVIDNADVVQDFVGMSGSATIYEDGNDASDWEVYDNNPPGSISVALDGGPGGVGDNAIELSGTAPQNPPNTDILNGTGFRVINNWQNNGQFEALWNLKTTEDVVFYVQLDTSNGTRYIQYDSFRPPDQCFQSTNTQYVVCGLPANAKDGNWNTIIKDLEADMASIQPNTQILQVVRMLIRGNLLIDTIRFE